MQEGLEPSTTQEHLLLEGLHGGSTVGWDFLRLHHVYYLFYEYVCGSEKSRFLLNVSEQCALSVVRRL